MRLTTASSDTGHEYAFLDSKEATDASKKHDFTIKYVWELHGAEDPDIAFGAILGLGFFVAVGGIAIVALTEMDKYADKTGTIRIDSR